MSFVERLFLLCPPLLKVPPHVCILHVYRITELEEVNAQAAEQLALATEEKSLVEKQLQSQREVSDNM